MLACAIAAVLLTGGALVLARARRRRREMAASHAKSVSGAGVALSSVLGVILLMGAFSPAPAAHAAEPTQCNSIAVSNVEIGSSAVIDGSIQLLPGTEPAVIRASITNTANVPVTLTALARTDDTVPMTKRIVWNSKSSSGASVETTLGDSTSHPLGNLAPGETTTVTFTLSLPASIGNEYQGQTVPLSLLVQAVQQGF